MAPRTSRAETVRAHSLGGKNNELFSRPCGDIIGFLPPHIIYLRCKYMVCLPSRGLKTRYPGYTTGPSTRGGGACRKYASNVQRVTRG